ncbi:hypothetical protein KAR91_70365 [Candidatus Pacearchaeota archaeon]|nr:hypothetical protein [Candidatus Pacearchaeota archaeon]
MSPVISATQFETLEEAQKAYDELHTSHLKLLDECSAGIEKAFEMVKSFGEASKIIREGSDDSKTHQRRV